LFAIESNSQLRAWTAIKARKKAQTGKKEQKGDPRIFNVRGGNAMKLSIMIGLLLLAASLQPASAGLGEHSSPERARCENEASAKIAMWNWFVRRDFVTRCMSNRASGGKIKKRAKST